MIILKEVIDMSRFFKLTHNKCNAINAKIVFMIEDNNNITMNSWHEKLIVIEGFCSVIQRILSPQ